MSKQDILLETGTNELEILEFIINEVAPDNTVISSHFGINVAKVMQVIETPGLEHPESASHPSFLGTIPLRHHILPVLDLSIWLNIERVASPFDNVIVTEFSQAVTGFLVSGVTEIHRVAWSEVIPPGNYLDSFERNAIIGMVDKGDRFIQLLDVESILSELEDKDDTPSEPSAIDGKGYIALVADDSATIRLMLQKSLTHAGFQPVIVNNGKEALQQLQSLKEQSQSEGRPLKEYVNVVISDIEMPLKDGFSLTKNIKEDDALSALPVLLYSSIITKELRHKGDSVGADAQISKPEMNLLPEYALNLIEGRSV